MKPKCNQRITETKFWDLTALNKVVTSFTQNEPIIVLIKKKHLQMGANGEMTKSHVYLKVANTLFRKSDYLCYLSLMVPAVFIFAHNVRVK